MAWVDEDEYSRVDTAKVLDCADALEKAVRRMSNSLAAMDKAANKVFADPSRWRGSAADKWYGDFWDARARVAEDIEKYKQFPKYMRYRVEQYIMAAIDAEQTAEDLQQDVRALLNDLLQETGGAARVRDIRAAHKAKSGS